MKFSIIICTYNSIDGLSKTLNSILTQTFDNFEIVIIDGMSSDGTLDIIKDYEEKFAGKFRWISESDFGIYDAMNKGIDFARGEWLYFLGGGDILFDDSVLEKIAVAIEDNQYDIVYGNVQMGDRNKIYDGEFSREKLIEKNISHQAIFYKKRVFEKLGVYNKKYKTLADWEFNMRWINDVNIKSKYTDIVIAKFELGGSSKTTFDKIFYDNFSDNIRKYFSEELFEVYKKKKNTEIDFVTSERLWKIWEWKNKFEFALFHPIDFLKKYTKK